MRLALTLLALASHPALAEGPTVTGAKAMHEGNTWTLDVSLEHPDTGWDHYADAWRIEAPDGTVLGQRDLAHPHVEEQPFTRSLSGVGLPEGVTEVLIRPRCSVDGWADETYNMKLP
jgi:hypothetical protein